MTFQTGNQHWKARTTHGRDRIIKDPETLAKAADEYFKWCIDNPLTKMDFKGKDAERVMYELPRPFKKGEFARFCHLSEWRLIEDLKKVSSDFSQIITYIEGTIYDQKYEYAAIGVFNTNIMSRDLGLTEKIDKTVKITKKRVGFGKRGN
jgi:hypothetical protein